MLCFADALGMGAFCVMGAEKALVKAVDPLCAAILGLVTATFGGVTRDVLTRRPVRIFHATIDGAEKSKNATGYLWVLSIRILQTCCEVDEDLAGGSVRLPHDRDDARRGAPRPESAPEDGHASNCGFSRRRSRSPTPWLHVYRVWRTLGARRWWQGGTCFSCFADCHKSCQIRLPAAPRGPIVCSRSRPSI